MNQTFPYRKLTLIIGVLVAVVVGFTLLWPFIQLQTAPAAPKASVSLLREAVAWSVDQFRSAVSL